MADWMLVTLMIETVHDGPLHLIGFKVMMKGHSDIYMCKHLVKLTGASQVAVQVMQVHDDEVVEIGDELIWMLHKEDPTKSLFEMFVELMTR
jgi:hypothetical protein